MPKAERSAREGVEGEGNSGPCGNWNSQSSDLQNGRTAPAIPGVSAVLGTADTLPDPQAPRSLRGPSKAVANRDFFFKYIFLSFDSHIKQT